MQNAEHQEHIEIRITMFSMNLQGDFPFYFKQRKLNPGLGSGRGGTGKQDKEEALNYTRCNVFQ